MGVLLIDEEPVTLSGMTQEEVERRLRLAYQDYLYFSALDGNEQPMSFEQYQRAI